jgi:hypothetical protein
VGGGNPLHWRRIVGTLIGLMISFTILSWIASYGS